MTEREKHLLKRIDQHKKVLANITLRKEVRLRVEDNLKNLEKELKEEVNK